ncbi:hypothetical protein Tco_0580209 [Tanacetum coccineum]
MPRLHGPSEVKLVSFFSSMILGIQLSDLLCDLTASAPCALDIDRLWDTLLKGSAEASYQSLISFIDSDLVQHHFRPKSVSEKSESDSTQSLDTNISDVMGSHVRLRHLHRIITNPDLPPGIFIKRRGSKQKLSLHEPKRP